MRQGELAEGRIAIQVESNARGSAEVFPHVLFVRTLPLAERSRSAVAVIAESFQQRMLQPGAPLSFWRTVGNRPTTTESAGLIASALFEMAAVLGWGIVERHGSPVEATAPAPGELWGLDASVFWPKLDLCVRPDEGPLWLGMEVGGSGLLISVRGQSPRVHRCELSSVCEETIETRGGTFRENRIRRSTFELASGVLRRQEVIAVNRRRLAPRSGFTR